jgi:hypothetical protein
MGNDNDPGPGAHQPALEDYDSRRGPFAQPGTPSNGAGEPAQAHAPEPRGESDEEGLPTYESSKTFTAPDAPKIASGGMPARQPVKRPSKRRRPRGSSRSPSLASPPSPDAQVAQDGQPQSVTPSGPRPALMTLHDASKRLATETELGAHAPALITLKRWSAARYLEGAKHFLPGRHHPLYNYAVIKEFCLQRLPVRDFAAVSYPAPVRPLLAQAPSEADPSRDLLAPVQAVEPPEELTPEKVAPANPSRGGADTTGAAGDGAPLAGQHREMKAVYQAMAQDLARSQAIQAQMLGTLQDLSNRMDAFGTQIVKLASAVSDLEHTRKTLMARYDGEMTSLRVRLDQAQGAARDNPGLEVAAARLGQAVYRIEAALQELAATQKGALPMPSSQQASDLTVSPPPSSSAVGPAGVPGASGTSGSAARPSPTLFEEEED